MWKKFWKKSLKKKNFEKKFWQKKIWRKKIWKKIFLKKKFWKKNLEKNFFEKKKFWIQSRMILVNTVPNPNQRPQRGDILGMLVCTYACTPRLCKGLNTMHFTRHCPFQDCRGPMTEALWITLNQGPHKWRCPTGNRLKTFLWI